MSEAEKGGGVFLGGYSIIIVANKKLAFRVRSTIISMCKRFYFHSTYVQVNHDHIDCFRCHVKEEGLSTSLKMTFCL